MNPSLPSDGDRGTGPVPQGSPPTSADASAGASPTGHPSPSPGDSDEFDSSAEQEEQVGGDAGSLKMEDLIAQLEIVAAERDEYLALAQAKQAEFENFRKRTMKQQAEEVARSAARLVEALLPVLDAFDYGVAHGDESLVPMRAQLLGVLEREGLTRLHPTDQPFDPKEHEAVAHEAGDGGEPTVAETLRAGYRWQGHLLRPVMVKVRD